MKKKNSFGRQLLLYVVLFGVIIVMLSSLFYKDTEGTAIENYSELATYIQKDEVKSVYVHNTGKVTLTLRDESQKSYTLAYVDMFYQDFQDTLLANGVVVEYQPQETLPWWVSLLPTLGIIILFVVIYFKTRIHKITMICNLPKCFLTVFKFFYYNLIFFPFWCL